MVKRGIKTTVSSQFINDNGKRDASDTKEPRKRFKGKSLYRQPTANELNRLQETENLFNSNLFRLQVEEVLHEVKVKEKTKKIIQSWLIDFKQHLEAIRVDETEYDLTQPALFKKLKVKNPLPNELDKTKCVFKFHKFTDIIVVGSYALDCSIESKLVIDILISVPSETYTKNDSINYRYHKKRAAYLAYIASHLKSSEHVEDIKYLSQNGSHVRPVLQITPNGKLAKHFSVHIDLGCEQDIFKLQRFHPTRNNLRESWLFNTEPSDNELGPPTPYYNSSVLHDLNQQINDIFLNDTLLNSKNLKEAIILLKIWMRQRKLQVPGHIVNMLISYLVQTKRINNIMSSYQIVRNVWISIKASEWNKTGISLYKGENAPNIEEFHQNFPIVFIDCTGYYNICWQMSLGTYMALKRESSLAVDMLDDGKLNSFIPLFMTPVTCLMQFDHILRFKDLSKIKENILKRCSNERKVNFGVDDLALTINMLEELLYEGLGNRVFLIQNVLESDCAWPVNKSLKKYKSQGYEEKLSFGFVLDPVNCLNIVDKGPPANLPEAEQFRAFWGDKSELRRFQDGSITEACVWDASSLTQRRHITATIVCYLLNHKFGISEDELFLIGDQLDSLLAYKRFAETPCEETALAAVQSFDALRNDLRSLTQLALNVSAVYGTSPVFSYSDPLPPLPRPAPPSSAPHRARSALLKYIEKQDVPVLPEYTPIIEAVVELGESGKWPGDLEAFRCVKAAFHQQIAARLTAQCSVPAQAAVTHVDAWRDNRVFRLKVSHPKEVTLLRRVSQEKCDDLRRDNILLPRLRGALHALHTRHPAFGPTVCLMKRWLSAHLLSPPHIGATACELLVAFVFASPQPLSAPVVPFAALVRVWHLLAQTDWTQKMLLIDFNNDMPSEDIVELERQFNSRSPTDPYMYIVSSYDGDLPSVWTRCNPTRQVVTRVATLARSALKYVDTALLNDTTDNIMSIYVPSLRGYDVLIHLHTKLSPHYRERVDQKPELRPLPTMKQSDDDFIPVAAFNPVQIYLEELRHAYSEWALFFHDTYGGDVIAVLWKPEVNELTDFQIARANALTPIEAKCETKYAVNKAALTEDFALLGKGLVRDVTVCT